MPIHKIEPSINELSPQAAAYFFYTEYDPAKHFTYDIVFEEDGVTQNEQDTLIEKQKAWKKCFEYMIDFEQPLPKYFFEFYIPKSNAIQEAYENDLNHSINELNLVKLSPKEINISDLYTINNKTGSINSSFCYGDGEGSVVLVTDEISAMPFETALKVYNYRQNFLKNNQEFVNIFEDATRYNQYIYNIAAYLKVSHPTQYSISIKEYNKIIKKVNSTFNFKIPVDPGMYKYSKFEKKWVLINEEV